MPQVNLQQRRIRVGRKSVAFEEIVETHSTSIVRLFRRLGADAASAEDLAQEVFVRLLRSRSDYEPRGRLAFYLDRIARAIRRTGVRTRAAVRVAANPAVEILDEAAHERVDAIVVTTHGVGGMRRLLLGSVVDKLVRGAEVPVLVCRPAPAPRNVPARRPMRIHQGV